MRITGSLVYSFRTAVFFVDLRTKNSMQGRRSVVKSGGGLLEGNVVKLLQAARHCWGLGGVVSPPTGSFTPVAKHVF